MHISTLLLVPRVLVCVTTIWSIIALGIIWMDLPVFTPAWWVDLGTENRMKYIQFSSVAAVRTIQMVQGEPRMTRDGSTLDWNQVFTESFFLLEKKLATGSYMYASAYQTNSHLNNHGHPLRLTRLEWMHKHPILLLLQSTANVLI